MSLEHNNITGTGLRAPAPYLESLESLALERSIKNTPLPPRETVEGWVSALCDCAEFRGLKAVSLGKTAPSAGDEKRLKLLLPKLKSVTGRPVPVAKVEAMP